MFVASTDTLPNSCPTGGCDYCPITGCNEHRSTRTLSDNNYTLCITTNEWQSDTTERKALEKAKAMREEVIRIRQSERIKSQEIQVQLKPPKSQAPVVENKPMVSMKWLLKKHS